MKLFMISGDDSDPENDSKDKPVTQTKTKPTQEKKGLFAKKAEESKPSASKWGRKKVEEEESEEEPEESEEQETEDEEEDAAY